MSRGHARNIKGRGKSLAYAGRGENEICEIEFGQCFVAQMDPLETA